MNFDPIKEKNKTNSSNIHPDLLAANKFAYEPSGLLYKNLVKEAESQQYGASVFEMNNKLIKFRVGKITPTKIGQFVTLWKRIGDGDTMPHDLSDPVDFFVVSVRNGELLGQFVFPKLILFEKGIVSKEGKGGKRGIRIYPPWDITDSKQARGTQAWQLKYFFEIKSNTAIDASIIKKLFQC